MAVRGEIILLTFNFKLFLSNFLMTTSRGDLSRFISSGEIKCDLILVLSFVFNILSVNEGVSSGFEITSVWLLGSDGLLTDYVSQ